MSRSSAREQRTQAVNTAELIQASPPVAAKKSQPTPAQFRDGMRALAAGVCVIATGRQGRRAGFTATAVCSVTADPPRLLVCINKSVSSYESLVTAGRLSINVLGQHQESTAKLFAGMVPEVKGEDRFQPGEWTEGLAVPVLTEACASFVCSIAELIPQSTHTIFLCDVLDARRGTTPASQPDQALVYANGQFTGLESD